MWFTLALIAAGFLAFGLPTAPGTDMPPVSQGYSLENYIVEKITDESCQRATECETPGEYLIQSKCPFTSLCLENKCAVVCPATEADANWQTFTDATEGITFRYPAELSTTYIRALDWPPQVQVTEGPFECTEAGNEIERAGRTELRRVDDRAYCVTKLAEGAAGSVYTQYAYAFEKAGKVSIFTFSTRAVQCANYDDPQKSMCEGERETFDIDGVIDRVAMSFRFK